MISAKYRFHGHGSVRYVLKNGQSQWSHAMSIKYVDNPRRHYSRLAIIVSKRVLRHAVDRNRARRRLFELARTRLLPRLSRPMDIVIVVTDGGIIDEAPERLVADFDKLCGKIPL